MTSEPDPLLIQASCRLYRLLLSAYPTTFRQDYRQEMGSLFRDCCRARYQERGAAGLLPLWGRALCDLAVNLPKEHAMRILHKAPPALPGRVCSNCSSEVMEEWTTCPICGSHLSSGTTREGYLPHAKGGVRAFDTELRRQAEKGTWLIGP